MRLERAAGPAALLHSIASGWKGGVSVLARIPAGEHGSVEDSPTQTFCFGSISQVIAPDCAAKYPSQMVFAKCSVDSMASI